MVQQLYDFLLEIPQAVSKFGEWLTQPLYEPYIKLSPIALLGLSGTAVLIGIIAVHVVRLFV